MTKRQGGSKESEIAGRRRHFSHEELVLLHPLPGEVVLETPPIRMAYREIKVLLVVGGQSCCFTAPSSSGKSCAIALIREYLEREFGDIPVFVFNVTDSNDQAIKEFLVQWLDVLCHGDVTGTAYSLRQRIVKRLLDVARAAGARKIIFLFDEAQNMTARDIKFLKAIYNYLFTKQVHLVTVSFGQSPEFATKMKELVAHRDLVRRFFACRFRFGDISLPEEVKALFHEIDHLPFVEAGVTWTQFYAPYAWEKGWRLEGEVTTLEGALRETGFLPITVAAQSETISMGLLLPALRRFLTALASDDAPDIALPLDGKRWCEALRACGYEMAGEEGDDPPRTTGKHSKTGKK
jgi:hypothetical protein